MVRPDLRDGLKSMPLRYAILEIGKSAAFNTETRLSYSGNLLPVIENCIWLGRRSTHTRNCVWDRPEELNSRLVMTQNDAALKIQGAWDRHMNPILRWNLSLGTLSECLRYEKYTADAYLKNPKQTRKALNYAIYLHSAKVCPRVVLKFVVAIFAYIAWLCCGSASLWWRIETWTW